MLLLFETPAGFALFTVLQENKLEEAKVGAEKLADHMVMESWNASYNISKCCRIFGRILRPWTMRIR